MQKHKIVHPSEKMLDEAKLELFAAGILPPKGSETALFCSAAFFAGCTIFSNGEEWILRSVFVFSFLAISLYFGDYYDRAYNLKVHERAKEIKNTKKTD